VSTDKPKALLIVALGSTLLPGEQAAKARLELHFEVEVKEASAHGLDMRDTALMVVSSSVKDTEFGKQSGDWVVPHHCFLKRAVRRPRDVPHIEKNH
jgi:hypothetical protein